MGACLSCLGLDRQGDSDPSDTHPLLNEPYPPNHYGTVDSQTRTSPQVDPEEIRRQRDALERLCAATSDKLIDVTHTTSTSPDQPALRSKLVTDYPRLFAEQFGGAIGDERPESDSTLADEDEQAKALIEVLENEHDGLATWKTPAGLESLSITFDDLLGVGGNVRAKAIA